MKTFTVITLALLSLMMRAVEAHPVAQGAVDVEILPDKILLHLRVSTEEVFVQNAFGNQDARGLADVWPQHGEYLLKHFQVSDGTRNLAGRLARTIAPDDQQNGRVGYELEYPLAAAVSQLRVEENALREIEYAPGNPWEASFIVQVHQHGQQVAQGLLLTAKQPLAMNLDQLTGAAGIRRGRMFADFLRHGVMHILGGYDHLLFVGALALAVVSLWDLVKVVSAFTVAHTVTLTLSVLNIVRLPEKVVEPMIAASIVFVALANVFWPSRSRGWVRLLTAFFFGLFHGLGFAGGLLNAMEGMSGMTVGLAIVAFSVGVELGHQMVVLPVFGAMKFVRSTQTDDEDRQLVSMRAMRYGSALISVAGAMYLIAALR